MVKIEAKILVLWHYFQSIVDLPKSLIIKVVELWYFSPVSAYIMYSAEPEINRSYQWK